MRRRGKTPTYKPRDRQDNLPELMHNVRQARRNVLVARGHLIAHLRAEEDAVQRAWHAGATHAELAAATGNTWHPGWVHPALRRLHRARR